MDGGETKLLEGGRGCWEDISLDVHHQEPNTEERVKEGVLAIHCCVTNYPQTEWRVKRRDFCTSGLNGVA